MTELFGLVVCGGRSKRMGTAKCFLEYHGIPQWEYIVQLLQPFCNRVIISCNFSQVKLFPDSVDCIVDADNYVNIGPMAGLLSAFEKYPSVDFLTIGCDYPFITKKNILQLIRGNNDELLAVSMFNDAENIVEPLLALYRKHSFELLKSNFQNGNYSLRFFLEENHAGKVIPLSLNDIISVDTVEAFEKVKKEIVK